MQSICLEINTVQWMTKMTEEIIMFKEGNLDFYVYINKMSLYNIIKNENVK